MIRPLTLAVVALTLVAGCDKKPADTRPPRYPTYGTVTYNGKPPKAATVLFVPAGGSDWRTLKPAARVGPDGTYRLNSYDPGDGAPAGEYLVLVVWTGENEDNPIPDLFKGRYSDTGRPVLKVTIKEGDNEIPPIKLTGPPIGAADAVGPSGGVPGS